MNVLIACEESQRVCLAFLEKGHNAFSCDIQAPSGGRPDRHILGDVSTLLKKACYFHTMDFKLHHVPQWDIIIAHPPCTYLSNAGACRLFPKGELNIDRYKKGLEAKAFFMQFYFADCAKIAIENPIPMKIFDLPKYTQIIQPYQFGHPYTKKTCLWLNGLPKLQPTEIVEPVSPWCPNSGTKQRGFASDNPKTRKKERSKTFEGIARAMAEQWG